MLDIQWPLERLFQYAPTSLERDYQHDVLLDTTLGIVVDMVTPAAYMLPEGAAPKLAPEDEALLAPEKETLAGKDRRGQRKKAISVPWLRKSEFITAVFDENLYNQSTSLQSDIVHAASVKSAKGMESAQAAFAVAGVEAVNRQFAAAGSGVDPVHPKDPTLKAVSVQYLIPNYDYLSNVLVHVLYEDVPTVERDGKREREEAVLQLHELTGFGQQGPSKTGTQKRLVTRLLPDVRDDVDELFGDAEEGGEPEYHLTGQFSCAWQNQLAESKYLLLWGEDEAVSYIPFDAKVELAKHDLRGSSVGKIAKRYKISHRSDEERLAERRAEKFAMLFGDEDDGEAAPMQEGDDEVDLKELEDAPAQDAEDAVDRVVEQDSPDGKE